MPQAIVHASGADNEMAPLNAKQSKWTLPVLEKTIPSYVVENLQDIGIEDITVVSNEPITRDSVPCEAVSERRFLDLDEDKPTLVVRGDTDYHWSKLESFVDEGTAIGYTEVEVVDDGLTLQTNEGMVTEFASSYGEYSGDAYLFPAGFYDETQDELDLLQELVLDYEVQAVDVGHTQRIQYPHEFGQFVLSQFDDGAVGLKGEEPETLPNATIEGTVVLMGDNDIGPGAVLEDTVLLPGASVGANSYVGHSVLGEDVRIGPGVTTEFDNGGDTVKAQYPVGKTDTGFKKFGAILGPRAEVRAGATLTKGTVLGSANVVREGVVR